MESLGFGENVHSQHLYLTLSDWSYKTTSITQFLSKWDLNVYLNVNFLLVMVIADMVMTEHGPKHATGGSIAKGKQPSYKHSTNMGFIPYS